MTTARRMSSVSATHTRIYGAIGGMNFPLGIGQVSGEVIL